MKAGYKTIHTQVSEQCFVESALEELKVSHTHTHTRTHTLKCYVYLVCLQARELVLKQAQSLHQEVKDGNYTQ